MPTETQETATRNTRSRAKSVKLEIPKDEQVSRRQTSKRKHVEVEYEAASPKTIKIKTESEEIKTTVTTPVKPSPTKIWASLERVKSDPSLIADNSRDETSKSPTKGKGKKKSPSSPRKSGPPKNWEEVYELIKQFRLSEPTAPVDVVGCGWLASRDHTPELFRYQTLVALQLSSQTKDPIVAAAIDRLKTQLPKGLTPESILETSDETLEALLRGVSFHKRKTTYLKATAKICIEQFKSDIPSTLEGLKALPGVGPKMAFLAMQCAWDTNVGIGVDTHVHRIANRLGWVKSKDTAPEETREQLEVWLPHEYWAEVNPLLVGFGQTVCMAVKPKCHECPAKALCPKIGTRS
ncbi:DNA N-glycosylase and apurinic/apyrimidinic (AP) lyase [Chytridiales sp. JEL 0842]|nr:DNA N-glycosylase and apurinic/apyrimidinic (AP) lyase [Chytridiales sp. JEL 0842]